MSVTFTAAMAHDDAPELNMANGNAAAVLELLGYETDQVEVLGHPISYGYGEAPAEDFLGRVLVALALVDTASDNEGTPTVADGNWITCGRRPGYLADRLTQLHHLAEWAVTTDATWCGPDRPDLRGSSTRHLLTEEISVATRAQYDFEAQHPHPGDDPVARLRHTVELFDGQPDTEFAIVATSNAYPDGDKTGLTWGDLRALLARLEG